MCDMEVMRQEASLLKEQMDMVKEDIRKVSGSVGIACVRACVCVCVRVCVCVCMRACVFAYLKLRTSV